MTIRERAIEAGCGVMRGPARLLSRQRKPGVIARAVIVKPASVGDVLMATPTVRALRALLPRAHLAVAVGRWSRAMIEGNPQLDGIVDLYGIGGRGFPAADYWRALRSLRAGRYDLAVVLDRSPIVGLLPFLAGIPWRVGLDSSGRGFAHHVRVPCPPRRHEAQLYLDVAAACGSPRSQRNEQRMEFFATRGDEEFAGNILQRYVPDLATGDTDHAVRQRVGRVALAAIHPAGGVNPGATVLAKRWPASRFAGIADRLIEQLGARVALIGGQGDAAVVAEVRGAMRNPAIDLSGQLTWGQLGVLLRHCRLMIANDTGAAHLAMANGTRTVMIFGPTDAAQYGPAVADLGEAVTLGLPCSPCFQRGRLRPCLENHGCLTDLEERRVWQAVLRQWTTAGEPPHSNLIKQESADAPAR